MERHAPTNAGIVEKRMGMPLDDYIQKCIERLEVLPNKNLMSELGELTDAKMKTFVRTGLRQEVMRLL